MHQSSVHFPCRLHALALSHDGTARRSDIRQLMVAGSGMVPHHPGACGPTRREPLLWAHSAAWQCTIFVAAVRDTSIRARCCSRGASLEPQVTPNTCVA